MSEFCYGAAIVVGLIMLLLIWGTPKHITFGHRPPPHPPGWKNIQRAQKRAVKTGRRARKEVRIHK
jgi:hypothetical protein